jgi:hypothetical protein
MEIIGDSSNPENIKGVKFKSINLYKPIFIVIYRNDDILQDRRFF